MVRDAERCSLMEAWEEMKGTLEGRESVVSGRLLPFAVVSALDGSGLAVEYSWETLRNLIYKARVIGKAPVARV